MLYEIYRYLGCGLNTCITQDKNQDSTLNGAFNCYSMTGYYNNTIIQVHYCLKEVHGLTFSIEGFSRSKEYETTGRVYGIADPRTNNRSKTPRIASTMKNRCLSVIT